VQVDEEIEIKQLRKEQVPRAHPMPDFSKPFVPKRYRISDPFVFSDDLSIYIFFCMSNHSVSQISAPKKGLSQFKP
jgi:hypothetical protein